MAPKKQEAKEPSKPVEKSPVKEAKDVKAPPKEEKAAAKTPAKEEKKKGTKTRNDASDRAWKEARCSQRSEERR